MSDDIGLHMYQHTSGGKYGIMGLRHASTCIATSVPEADEFLAPLPFPKGMAQASVKVFFTQSDTRSEYGCRMSGIGGLDNEFLTMSAAFLRTLGRGSRQS